VTSTNAPAAPSKQGIGKDLMRKQINMAKIVVKISMQKAWLFNIYESDVTKAF